MSATVQLRYSVLARSRLFYSCRRFDVPAKNRSDALDPGLECIAFVVFFMKGFEVLYRGLPCPVAGEGSVGVSEPSDCL